MPRLVDCYLCGFPVTFDPSGKLEEDGITLEECERNNLAVICNLCVDMAEVENVEIEVVSTTEELKSHFKEAV